MAKESHPNRLRVVLAEKQIKNGWLAEQLGKSEMVVSRWSTNKAQPSLDQLIEIAKLLNVKLDDLVEPYDEGGSLQCNKEQQYISKHMNHRITLPIWLDDLVFKEFKAVYHPCPEDVQYGPDQGLDHILTYLGTYFPRSYTECFCIVERLLHNEKYKKELDGLEEINIFDFCCGTGGELFGAIMAFQTCLPNLKRINIDAFDANPWAIRILTKFYHEYLPKVREIYVDVNLKLNPIFIENEQYLQDVDNMLNRSYHLIMSFKALNEFVQGSTFDKENVYAKVANIFSNKLAEKGVMLLLDVSSRNKTSGVYYPEMLNRGLNDVIKNSDSFKTIIPHSCYFREGICAPCYMQDIFYVSHSGHKNDVSKVAYRIICKKDFANILMENYKVCPPCRASSPNAYRDTPYQDL